MHSLHSDIRKSIENVVNQWKSSKTLDDQVGVILECIANRDYLTVYQLGEADIDVTILHSLMKGT